MSRLGHGYAGVLAALVVLFALMNYRPAIGLVVIPLLVIVVCWNFALWLAFANMAVQRMGYESLGTPADLTRWTTWVATKGRTVLLPTYAIEVAAVVVTVFGIP